MDLKLIGAPATEAEHRVVEAAVPAALSVDEPGRVVRSARSLRHHLLPALAAVQSEVGWVSPGAIDEIARRLQVPPAEVYSVATFYALLSTEVRPDVVAHVCDDIACGPDLVAALGDRDDVVASPCLGQCDRRPAAYVQRAGQPDSVVLAATLADVDAAVGGESPYFPQPFIAPGPLLARVGVVDPTSLDDYRSHSGYAALAVALQTGPEAVIEEITASNLRGRGGAAFPTGIKWDGARSQPGPRYVICNADESEPGTFKDRVVMEGDPFAVIEALTIAGVTVGAEQGYIYVRGEYPDATRRLQGAIDSAGRAGLLGPDVMGSGLAFDIELRRGQGAYICGEETALFASIEGYRGEPRQKPPFPTVAGLFGRPTVINNVETLINVPRILLDGGAAYAATGTEQSPGTRLFCLSGNLARPGVYELESGTRLGEAVESAGGDLDQIPFLLLGGAAGTLVAGDRWDLPLTFEDSRAADVTLGSGVIMAFGPDTDMRWVVSRIARFFRDESCGQCVPCRVGTVRVEEAVARATDRVDADLIDELDRAMKDASICGLGHTASSVVRSAIGLGIL
ncbi:MAG TPA: NADH-ubiquinone oxidoreductase-F iron-sulfur binding region domain-containing protein [Acidimicrobiia bacterium]|nr:NADH-ubiquinone oxidoreductase-F iron-sulfur binding region domain-containing protein [Acidimicrobiia bacterium]